MMAWLLVIAPLSRLSFALVISERIELATNGSVDYCPLDGIIGRIFRVRFGMKTFLGM